MSVNNLWCEFRLEAQHLIDAAQTGDFWFQWCVCVCVTVCAFAPPTEYTIASDEANHPPCAAVLDEGHQELTDPL